ncbi:hypothetical protein [Clostridium rectalis]|uniref:hypothetical protein n=1 Tax=Clostridium rectalis TaxID=2040295 RepID=UPI000F63F700|nr:hypothetical protein [Clostridium rectalis]
MIICTNISLALKNIRGEYDLKDVSLFEIKNKISTSFKNIKVVDKYIEFRVYCPLCEGYHNYKYKLKDIFKNNLIVGGCEELGLPLFYIGSHDRINKKIAEYNNINNTIYAML